CVRVGLAAGWAFDYW
nr:immunoglobulin heavy chain junction region [Macaca mulatta]MOX93581.1 immunoglobulin heavy chain junction region [Macaca mulatta]MOX94331.1 immunoglobulin heavy chain junction region [Macaca mulatta]MOX95012.1 immunoglobulin heavy chain junction region [Macaca mulatta]MOX97106.1 immunoglobulin heavy chain junction region [Macaca mulatta]